VLIPGGYVTAAYDPVFKLSPDRKRCLEAPSTVATALGAPGLPFRWCFAPTRAEEDVILRIASAYEAASMRRIPPPAFGPLPD